MNTALWIVAGFLTALFLLSGFGKVFGTREKLAGMTPAAAWALDFSPGALRAIGAAEVLGAVGLVLPALLRIAPILVPFAALGLALVMTGAVTVRLRRHELRYALMDLAYLALAAFVAVGRFGPAPITT
ncbi:DoxX family protein [Streptacidiphilus sp. N1-3]|uniref:DoxX family protein n=1 Tax=Streptacidiphilus alkalitolerans TaxID=3342712 RepID=A0ABV6X8Q8_9ACTN